jgi:16S rRNA processing protein RimM
MKQDTQKMVIMGTVAAPHGVRGLFKVKLFCERAEDLTAYGPLCLEDGRDILLHLKGMNKGLAICAAAEIHNREQAVSLRGSALYLAREKLPELGEGEIYQADLLGMQLCDSAGQVRGRVIALHDFGAGEIVEIQLAGSHKTEMLPYYPPFLKHVDVKAGRVIVDAYDAEEPEPEPETAGKGDAQEDI